MRSDVRTGKITQKGSAQLPADRIRQRASGELVPISQKPSGKSAVPGILLPLSWPHYVFFLGICDDSERCFVEECPARTFGQQAADQMSSFHIVVLIVRLSKEGSRERYCKPPTFEQIEAELQGELARNREGEA